MHDSWDTVCVRDRQMNGQTDGLTDRQTDGWKKWHIEVGVPPKTDKSVSKTRSATWLRKKKQNRIQKENKTKVKVKMNKNLLCLIKGATKL